VNSTHLADGKRGVSFLVNGRAAFHLDDDHRQVSLIAALLSGNALLTKKLYHLAKPREGRGLRALAFLPLPNHPK
jgi:hypothetical protein